MAGVPGMRDGLPHWAPELKPCGSLAAYRRHLRRGETPCWACRQANAANLRGRQARGDRQARRRNRIHLARPDDYTFCGKRWLTATDILDDVTCAMCLDVLARHYAKRIHADAAPPELPRDTAA